MTNQELQDKGGGLRTGAIRPRQEDGGELMYERLVGWRPKEIAVDDGDLEMAFAQIWEPIDPDDPDHPNNTGGDA